VTDVFELIPPVPGLVEQFKPRLKYLLIDENVYSDSELASVKNLVAAVFRIEHPTSPQAIGTLLSLLQEWLADRPDLRRMFALWIRATLMRRAEYSIVLPQVDDLQELNVMLAERLEEWAHGYEAQGLKKGMQQGEALLLQRQLARRFGALSAEHASPPPRPHNWKPGATGCWMRNRWTRYLVREKGPGSNLILEFQRESLSHSRWAWPRKRHKAASFCCGCDQKFHQRQDQRRRKNAPTAPKHSSGLRLPTLDQ